MREETGFTTAELLVVLALAAVLMTVAVTISLPMVVREATVGAIYSVQNHIQLARIEAVGRNRPCRFVVDTASREIQVLDSMGTTSTADDVVLHDATLPPTVRFATPNGDGPVTLEFLGGYLYGASFRSDGTVDSGFGDVTLFGGDEFRRISLFAGGGVGLERWSGAAWTVGS